MATTGMETAWQMACTVSKATGRASCLVEVEKTAPHPQIVRAVPFRLHRLLHRPGGHAQNPIRTQKAADLPGWPVLLAHMYAVRAALQRNLHAVVDEERDSIRPARGPDFPRFL